MFPISENRVLEILAEINSFSEFDDKTQRRVYSEADLKARSYLSNWIKGMGLHEERDAVGNQFAFQQAKGTEPYVAFGSHLDTVKDAGDYDGALGVAASMYLMELVNQHEIKTKYPLALINFMNEEGVRFAPDMMGSAYMARQLDLKTVYDAKDLDQPEVTLKQVIDTHDIAGQFDSQNLGIQHFVELHIEQGPVLESKGLDIGVVDKVQGIFWTEYKFLGRAQHSGTTPMNLRRNAGLAATEFAYKAAELAKEVKGHLLTNGVIEFSPNAPNIIPGEAKIILDSRNPNEASLVQFQLAIDGLSQEVARNHSVEILKVELARYTPVIFDEKLVDEIAQTAASCNFNYKEMVSGAGHDAQLMGKVHSSGMIFIPSLDGVSHNPAEYSSPSQIQKGLEVYIKTILKLAEVQ